MREWSLHAGDPLNLTLAADARLSTPRYVDDHIWELELVSGESPLLSLYTTYGLRARSMRIYPRFIESGDTIENPKDFTGPARIRQFFPNFLELSFSPFEGLDVTFEVRVPSSEVIAGRMTITNRTALSRNIMLEMCSVLAPLDGHSFTNTQMQMVNVLVGQTSDLIPLLFMTGGPYPGTGPQPSLLVDLELGSGDSRQLTWVQAATTEHQESFDTARLVAAQAWDAERQRIEMVNTSEMVDIYTSDPEWDAALAFSQKAAFGLFFPGNENLLHPSFVRARVPDLGYSRKGDGSDYPDTWNGQVPLEAYYLSSVLPVSPTLMQGIVRNFLITQSQDGTVDGSPGLGGQRGRYQAMPILAAFAWNVYHATDDIVFLAEVYPKLLAFFQAWFSPQNDRDGDGIPEWGHPLQTNYEDNPLFDTWNPWSQGADITSMHSPALMALLVKEAQALMKMAEQLGRTSEIKILKSRTSHMKAALENAWDTRAALYRYQDRSTGQSSSGKLIGRRRGSGMIKVKKEFEPPVRLLITVQTEAPATKRPQIVIGEYVTKGESEIIEGQQFQWCSGGLVATSREVHNKIGRVEVKGVEKKDKVIVRTVDHAGIDHSLLLPIWAEVLDENNVQRMISSNIRNSERFDRPFGLPAYPVVPKPEAEELSLSVFLPWNQLVCEGMLAYGFRADAARLVAHMMTGIIQNLKQQSAFYQRYHAETGEGLGERNALTGLAPVGLFLQVLGVQIFSATRVRLEGLNPFPWPVTVQYKGLRIIRGLERTEVFFQNGKHVTIDNPAPCFVSLSE